MSTPSATRIPEDQPPRPGRAMWTRFGIAALVIVTATAVVTATAALETVSGIAHDLGVNPRIQSSELTADQAGAAQTIMVVGSDKRARSTIVQDRASPPHSDTILLLRMDPHRSQTSVLSVPRDLKVRISPPGARPSVQKINAAYSIGGPKLTLKTVRHVLGGIQVNHVVDVNFQGFRRVVDAIGCVYVDVDRHYYHSNAGLAAGAQYAEIDIQPGYQKLCGQPALDYVRFRHTDSDFVRVARQQDFLRQVKEQVGLNGLLDKHTQIQKAIGQSIQTDIRGTADVLRLLKLAAFSLGRPVRQVKFRSTAGPSYVTATAAQLQGTVQDFLSGDQQPKLSARPGSARARGRGAAALNLLANSPASRDQALSAGTTVPYPILYPSLRTGPAVQQQARAYTLLDEQGRRHRAYRVVWQQNGALGEYYGIQGSDWMNPPLTRSPSETRTVGGRRYMFFNDGQHLHVIAWRTSRALYWVTNTLLEGLSNRQMLALAQSAQQLR